MYGGPLHFADEVVYANFVSAIDGIVALPVDQPARAISGDSDADRFVMALLRACADAIVVGSGTLLGSTSALWRVEGPYRQAAEALADLRRRLGLPPQPEVAILSASGNIDVSHPRLEEGALVLTSGRGAAALRESVPAATTVLDLGQELAVDPHAAIEALRARGHRRILSEAGPTLFGALLAADVVDELFLTVSPLLAGRMPLDGRLGLVEGVNLLPGRRVEGRLLSVRRSGEQLLLRYGLR
jgi:riboflavin biosynthesis pyrimidine reductase